MKDARNIEIDKIATDLNGKMDKDMTNMSPTSNVKAQIANWSFPSDRYINLELGASGSSYTAPANGWFLLSKKSTASNQYLTLFLSKTVMGFTTYATGASAGVRQFLPCKKGQVCKINYTLAGDVTDFRFVYAEGEQ